MAGTRIGLDVLIYEFQDGRSAEEILDLYPSIGSLAKAYGAIAFILEHSKEIATYLEGQHRNYEEFKTANPLSPDMIERFERGKRELPAQQS